MKIISTRTFKYTLRDVHKNTENRKFCFVIGAGASRKSGIPTGGELSEKWFKEIKERLENVELNAWIQDQKIDEEFLAESYGSIYRKRFENDKTTGYEFLVQAMKTAKPSYGHIVLGQILSRTSGHCVLTTNFDSLIESAVYQFTDKTPLVCGHESLSGYARPSQTHPLVIKIHRDLLLEPKSDPDEINMLAPGWKEPLDHIFSTHIPIIIGYGGNDGSLMSYFERMNKPSNFFWCGLDSNSLSDRISQLIKSHDGCFVKIKGFDDLMYELLWVFDEIKPINEELNLITNERIQIASKQLDEITILEIEVSTGTEKSIKAIEKIEGLNPPLIELSALEYSNKADRESDFEKRKDIYFEMLSKYPTTGWLWWKFTFFLHYEKCDFNNLEEYYTKALLYNPTEGGLISNYAQYVSEIKKDYSKADKFFLKALSFNEPAAATLLQYGHFLYHAKKDKRLAEEYYLKAIKKYPDDAPTLGSYGMFLFWEKRPDQAEEYFLKALSINSDDFVTLSNYAFFLKEVRKDYIKSEAYFTRVLAFERKDFKVFQHYANLLHYHKHSTSAEAYYIKSLKLNPDYSYSNLHYAVFLKNIKNDRDAALEYYLKALKDEPEDANANGCFAQFLLEEGKTEEANVYIETAFKGAEEDLILELWYYRYAHYPKFLTEAESKIEELLSNNIRSLNWDFNSNIRQALKDKHPNPKNLKDFAHRITTK